MARLYNPMPDEIVKEIIAPRFSIPDDLFHDTSLCASPFSVPSPHPCSNILAVSKQWMRVATPLLYQVIILRSSAQATSLARVLQKNPNFGEYIVKLRVEGGFGLAMEKILRFAPNVKELVLSMAIYSHDNVSGLVRSLPSISPTHLYLIDGAFKSPNRDQPWKKAHPPENTHSRSLATTLSECIREKWKHLRFCDFPYDCKTYYKCIKTGRSRAYEIADALASSVSIEIIAVPTRFSPKHIKILGRNKNLQCIRVKCPPSDPNGTPYVPQIHPDVESNERLRELVKYDTTTPALDESTPAMVLAANPFYTPLANVPQNIREHIWGRVIMFASAPYRVSDVANSSSVPNSVWLSRMRLRIAKVSKLFYQLTQPYLYQDPALWRISDLVAFSGTLRDRPSLALHVRSLFISSYVFFIGDYEGTSIEDAETELRWIIEGSVNLTDLEQINDTMLIFSHHEWSWKIIDSFRDAKMRRLSGLTVSAPSSKAGFLSLSKLENLTVLDIRCREGNYDNSEIDPVFPSDCLSQLEKLVCSESVPVLDKDDPFGVDPKWCTSLLGIILNLKLPALHSFTMQNALMQRSSDRDFESELHARRRIMATEPIPLDFKDFVTKHGHKLMDLELGSLGDSWSPLPYCPNLKRVTIFVGHEPPHLGFFNCGDMKQHPSLKKMTFAHLYEGKQFDSLPSEWPAFFENVGFQAFSSLELHIPACKWPTSDREIKQGKNVWVGRAERLSKELNVKITDVNGVHWVPRLGARARGKVKAA